MSAKDSLLARFASGDLSGKTFPELLKALSIPYRERNRLEQLLNDLISSGDLIETENGKFGTAESLGLIRGKLVGNERGFAFLVPSDREKHPEDFFVPHRNLHGAMHGDEVFAERLYADKDEATVLQIIKRGYSEIVGTFYKDRRAGCLCPDDKRYFENIYIPLSSCKNIKDGVKAVAKITEYPYGKAPGGEIMEVLGDETDFFAEELSIIRSFGLHENFPDGIEAEAERAAKHGIRPADLVHRTDFRDWTIITIDGEDTRDIDDAVSLKKQDENYLLGVHIADVSHYVKYLSPLDKEAYSRGTSVYFPDRVLPMLPKALSNGICSLNEGEDRLTLSCLMTIDKKGNVLSSTIANGIIRSTHRMTYTEISAILDGEEETTEKYADIKDMVALCAELANILKAAREKRGSVELDVKEAKILIDDKGEITIPTYERPFSYEIIEQFMVKTNETVAEYIQALDLPFLYRIHEKPDEEKAENFRAFAQSLGLTPKFNASEVKPYEFANLLKSAKDLPVYSVLNQVMLRSMQKARYAPVNVGHFGLASPCYCHFTSPIRRYPDLCVHRIIKEVLAGNYETVREKYVGFVSEAALHSSDAERNAERAEREVDALYAASYMSERIGEEYDAVVSGVATFGLFAELPIAVEGFIPVESLHEEFEYIPERFTLKGHAKSYSIGERIRVRVEDVDFYERRTIFSLVEEKAR